MCAECRVGCGVQSGDFAFVFCWAVGRSSMQHPFLLQGLGLHGANFRGHTVPLERTYTNGTLIQAFYPPKKTQGFFSPKLPRGTPPLKYYHYVPKNRHRLCLMIIYKQRLYFGTYW